jgi:hypothetical protein
MSAHPHTSNQPHSPRAADVANWVEDAAVALACLCAAVIVAGILALMVII